MDKRRFYVPGIVLGVVSFLFGFLAMPIESIMVSVIALGLCIRKKKEYRTKIGIVLTILGLLQAVPMLIFMIEMGINRTGEMSYWFFRLLF